LSPISNHPTGLRLRTSAPSLSFVFMTMVRQPSSPGFALEENIAGGQMLPRLQWSKFPENGSFGNFAASSFCRVLVAGRPRHFFLRL
jgi:hypothetical protein